MDLSRTPYESHIIVSSARYGLDPQLVRAVMSTESDFRERCVSHAGARGLMQVMPCTWAAVKKLYGLQWKYEENVFDPAKNVEVACAYLAWLRYDFLPKHFAAFPVAMTPPPSVVRDAAVRGPEARIVSWQDTPRTCQPVSARQTNGGAWFANRMLTGMGGKGDAASVARSARGRDEAVELRPRRRASKRVKATVAQKNRRNANRRARPES